MSRILGILSYVMIMLVFVSWAAFDVTADLTITFILSAVVLSADADVAYGINVLKHTRIDWRPKLVPPLVAMHTGLLLVVLSWFYYLGPLSFVGFLLTTLGAVPIVASPYLHPKQSVRGGWPFNRYVTIVGVWAPTTFVIMVLVYRSSTPFIPKLITLAGLAGFLIVLVTALWRHEKALERKAAQDAVGFDDTRPPARGIASEASYPSIQRTPSQA